MKVTCSKATTPKRDCRKTWKVWGAGRKLPVFEAKINTRGYPASVNGVATWLRDPIVEVTKFHAGGIGSVWGLDPEEVDALLDLLGAMKPRLAKAVTP